jgi:uncharacterized protein YcfL
MKTIFALILIIVLITGCESKKYEVELPKAEMGVRGGGLTH